MQKRISVLVLSAILISLFVYLGFALNRDIFPFGKESYQAVQLSNGNIYYGQLRTFPCCELTDAHFVQSADGETDSSPRLLSVSSLFFGPENTMHLQKDQIVWWADLSGDSQVLKAILGEE